MAHKPPLGIQPKIHWLETRYGDLKAAIEARVFDEKSSLDPTIAWSEEITEILKQLDTLRQQK